MQIDILARQSLLANIEALGSERLLTAGRNHFRTLWTRDFCMSVEGLIRIGEIQTAISHHQRLLREMREDGLVPRVFDSISTRVRVVLGCVMRMNFSLQGSLRGEFIDEHGSEAVDSNALAVIAADAIDRAKPGYWRDHETQLRKVIQFYIVKIGDSQLRQPAFSDWQDSVRREGISSFVQILLWKMFRIAQQRKIDLQKLEKKTEQFLNVKLFDPEKKIFRSLQGREQWNADATLLALLWDFFPASESEKVYQALKDSELWLRSPLGLPGSNTFPHYTSAEKSLSVRLTRSEGYHDRYYWTWLMGLAAQVAKKFSDHKEAERISLESEKLHHLSPGIEEIFDVTGKPLKTWAYRSECPFSWGAAWWV